MRALIFVSLLALFVLVMDLYAFRGIQHLLGATASGSRVPAVLYWGTTLLVFIAVLWAGSRFRQLRDPSRYFGIMVVMGIFLMLYIPKLLFNVLQLTGDVTAWVARLFHGRSELIKVAMLWTGAVSGLMLMLAFALGMVHGRTNVKVFREEIPIPGLPSAFEGLRVIQVSDLHLGGFYHHRAHIIQVVERINSLEPDLLLFTGDMVHNFAAEVEPFVEILNGLEAPLGKFAILGNHDYGHYFQWESEAAELSNLEQVKEQIRACGFDLLLNEHRRIRQNGSTLELIGVENWGKPPFPQMGNLEEAMKGTRPEHIKILLSHDPSHWDQRVRGLEPVILTLAGHTHGMQFGIELGRIKWSPSKWTYRHWAGLYRENGQYLYVNRGLGFTGYPGRVGIRPEITLLTLTRR